MYETVKRLFTTGHLTDEGVKNAVGKGWITEEQAYEILRTK